MGLYERKFRAGCQLAQNQRRKVMETGVRLVRMFTCLLSISALFFIGCDGGCGSTSSIPQLPDPPEPGSQECLAHIDDYASKGPFSYSRDSSGDVQMWVPNLPSGCKVPIVHLANATTATCNLYAETLAHLASHGFMAICYENPDTGFGTQCLEAVKTTIEQYPDKVTNKVGFTGHSQGGAAAFICTARAQRQWSADKATVAGHAIEPASGFGAAPSDWKDLYEELSAPMFMFNGSEDPLVSGAYVRQTFNMLNSGVEAYWYEAQGAPHVPIPNAWSAESATAWFRWKLLDDEAACRYFKKMPNSSQWKYQASQNETTCQ